jgi:hypothetical protein
MEDYIKSNINIEFLIVKYKNSCLCGKYQVIKSYYLRNIIKYIKNFSVINERDGYSIIINTNNIKTILNSFKKSIYNKAFNILKKDNNELIKSYFGVYLGNKRIIVNNYEYFSINKLKTSYFKIFLSNSDLIKYIEPQKIIALKLLENNDLDNSEIILAEAIKTENTK